MITFVVHLHVPPRNAAAFEKLMTYVAAMSNEHEPGVVYYAFARSVGETDTYVGIEVYSDAAAVAAHGQTQWVQDAVPESLLLIEGMPQIKQYVSPGTPPIAAQFDELT
jgi:quinol monooxygenase YgiN